MTEQKKIPLSDVAELASRGEEVTGTSTTADTSAASDVAAKEAAISNIMHFLKLNADDAGNKALLGDEGDTKAFEQKLRKLGQDDLLSLNELCEVIGADDTLRAGKVLKNELAQAVANTGLNQNPMEVAALNAEIGKIDSIEALNAFLANPDRVKNLTLSQFLLIGAKQYVLTHPVKASVETPVETPQVETPAETAKVETVEAPAAEAAKLVEVKAPEAPVINTNENSDAMLVMAEDMLKDGTADGFVETPYERLSANARLFSANAKQIANELNKLNGETAHLSTKAFNEDLAVELETLTKTVDATIAVDSYDANLMLNHRSATVAAFERVNNILDAQAAKIIPASARATQSLVAQREAIADLKTESTAFVTDALYMQAINSPVYKEIARAVRPHIAAKLNKKAYGTPEQMYQLVSDQIAKMQKRPDGAQIMQGMMEDKGAEHMANYFKAVTPFEAQTPKSEAAMDIALGKLAQVGREALAAPSMAHTAKKLLETMSTPAAEAELSDDEKFMNLMKDRARSNLPFGATDDMINTKIAEDLKALQADETGNGANIIKAIYMAATGNKDAKAAFKNSLATGTDTKRAAGLKELARIGKEAIAFETPRVKLPKAAKVKKEVALTDEKIRTVANAGAFGIDHLAGTEAPQDIAKAQETINAAYTAADGKIAAILAVYKNNMPKAKGEIETIESNWAGLKSKTAEGTDAVANAQTLSENRANTVYILDGVLKGLDTQQAALEKAIQKKASKKKSSAATQAGEGPAVTLSAEDLETLKTLPGLRAELKAAQGNYLESQMLANPEFKAKSEKLTDSLTALYQEHGLDADAAKAKAVGMMRDLAKQPEATKLADRMQSGLDAKQAFKDGTNTPEQQADAEQANAVIAAYKADDISAEKRWAVMQTLGGNAPKLKLNQRIGNAVAGTFIGTGKVANKAGIEWPTAILRVVREKYPTIIASGLVGAGVKFAGVTALGATTPAWALIGVGAVAGAALGGALFANMNYHYTQERKGGADKMKALGEAAKLAGKGLLSRKTWNAVARAVPILYRELPRAYEAMRAQEAAAGVTYGRWEKHGVAISKLTENEEGRIALGTVTGGLGGGLGATINVTGAGAAIVNTVVETYNDPNAALIALGTAGKGIGSSIGKLFENGTSIPTPPTGLTPPVELPTTATPTAAPAPMPAPASAGVPTVPVAPTTSGQGWDIFGFRQQVKALSDLKDSIIKNITPDLGSDDVMRNNEAVSIAKALNNGTPSSTPKGAYMDKFQKDYAGVKTGTNQSQGTGAGPKAPIAPKPSSAATGAQPQGARAGVPVAPLPETPEGIAAAIQKNFPTQAGAVTVQPNGDITMVFPSTDKANLAAQKMMAGKGMFKVPHSIQINESGQMIIKPNLSGAQNGMNIQSGPAPQPTSYAGGNQAAQGAARARWEQNGLPTFNGNTVVESNNSAPYFPQNGAGASRAAFMNSASTVSTMGVTPPAEPVTVYYTGQQPGVQPLPASKYIPTR